MSWTHIVPAVVLAAALHTLALRYVTALMTEVSVTYALALKIVGIEYASIAAIAGALIGLHLGNDTLAIVSCGFAYLFVGATALRAWVAFADGQSLGIGNGILIQAIQIPLLIPIVIVGSYFF